MRIDDATRIPRRLTVTVAQAAAMVPCDSTTATPPMPSPLPTAADACSWQAFMGCPSTWIVQAPQRAIPHPYLVPVSPMLSRRTQRSGVSGSTCTFSDWPLMFKVNCMNAFPLTKQRGLFVPRAAPNKAASEAEMTALVQFLRARFGTQAP
jgi:hypothetical protein